MSFLDKFVGVRFRHDEWKAIKEAVKEDSEKYDNPSHLIRVAVMKLLRE